ncbi:MAG TPA: SMI1/KNR4 family protein [Thermoanaerobaculia bacterium]|nr:SMI1/KNR4 family protein [Thermoanaerobaculia bacterium]
MTFDDLEKQLLTFADRNLGTGATEEEIREAEAKLGLHIAGSYRHFLHRFGWGGVGHLDLYGLGPCIPPYLNVVTVTQSERSEMRPRLAEHLLPVMNDGGGNLYCLDLGVENKGEPAVVFWDHEQSETQQPEVIAEDFITWLRAQLESI